MNFPSLFLYNSYLATLDVNGNIHRQKKFGLRKINHTTLKSRSFMSTLINISMFAMEHSTKTFNEKKGCCSSGSSKSIQKKTKEGSRGSTMEQCLLSCLRVLVNITNENIGMSSFIPIISFLLN